MKYVLTLSFKLDVETGDKDISDIERMVIISYSEYCGEQVTITKRIKR